MNFDDSDTYNGDTEYDMWGWTWTIQSIPELEVLGFDIKDFTPVPDIDPNAYELERKGRNASTPYFTTIDKFFKR